MNVDLRHRNSLILMGAGGHARVLLSLAQAAGLSIVAVCDPQLSDRCESTWFGLSVQDEDEALRRYDPSEFGIINGLGQLPGNQRRRNLFEKVKKFRFTFPVLIHPSAWVDKSVHLDEGVQVMAGAVIQPSCRIGKDTIINTRAGLDHDCQIGSHVHIAPGATLCGGVRIADDTFIGSGATIIQEVTVGRNAVLGAGTTLLKDMDDFSREVGAGSRRTEK